MSGNFQETYIGIIRPSKNSAFYCHCPNILKVITRLRLDLSHLWFHKFKHNFQDTLNPICNCGTVETTVHYFLHCPNFSNKRLIFFKKLRSIDANILSKDDFSISKVLLYGNQSFNDEKILLFTTSVEDIISTKHFDAPLFQNWHIYLSMSSLSFVFVMELFVNLFFFVLHLL